MRLRVLVISDSHRSVGTVERIILSQPQAKHIFFLGDNTADVEKLSYEYSDRFFHIVAGNCDFADTNPNFGIENIAGKRIFYTHGHTLSVKYGTERLFEKAKSLCCDIALYGHTHIAKTEYRDGIYLINPGSCARSREGGNSYAVIDIEKTGILPAIIKV